MHMLYFLATFFSVILLIELREHNVAIQKSSILFQEQSKTRAVNVCGLACNLEHHSEPGANRPGLTKVKDASGNNFRW